MNGWEKQKFYWSEALVHYNVLGEQCVIILSTIIAINVVLSYSFTSRRHVLYFIDILAVLFCCVANVFGCSAINFPDHYPAWVCPLCSTVYFALLIVPALISTMYTYEYSSVSRKHNAIFYATVCIPYAVYLVIVLLNFHFGWLFTFDKENGYQRGPLKYSTFITAAIYMVYATTVVLYNRRHLSRRLFTVFLLYPPITAGIMAVQIFYPYAVTSGLACFSPLLLFYLTIHSELSEVDISTGLFNMRRLAQELGKSINGWVAMISIENYRDLSESIGSDYIRQLIFEFGQKLTENFGRAVYYLENGRYCVVAQSDGIFQRRLPVVTRMLSTFTTEDGTSFSVAVRSAVFNVPESAKTYAQAIEFTARLSAYGKANNKRVVFSNPVFNDQLKRQNQIYEILVRELKNDSTQFQVYFQPIYSLKEKRFTYAEALSRLINTELGTISPEEFVRVAENRGLIDRLGNVAFDKICHFLSENPDKLQAVSVNFSVHQMMNQNIVKNVINTIQKYNIKPQNIIMEITESIFINDFETIKEHMIQLSQAGIVFYLDDFGTGYANFANVLQLPFTTIKIDRSLLLSMESDPQSYSFLKNLIYSFKSNGLSIVVEGVETEMQDNLVKTAGIDYIQGFLYSKPLPQTECLKLLAQG